MGCDASGRTDGWRATASPGYGTAYGGCPGYPYGNGLLARSVGRADHSLAPGGSYAAQMFWAPADTRIVAFSAFYTGFSTYPWVPGIWDPLSRRWINCGLACPFLVPQWTRMSYAGLSLRGIGIVVVCWASGCRRDGNNYGRAQLSHTSIVLADDWRPAVAITGGTLVDGRWHHGGQTLAYSARDNAGIRTVRMLVDGRVVGRADRRCDPHAVVPCSNAGGIMSLDTLAVFRRDGAHTITVQAIDGGYNVASATRRVYVDNTAPGQPGGLVVAGGGAWRSVNRFAASWAAPANYGSPIAGVVYELCRTDQPQACVSGRRWGSDLTSIRDLVVPAGARRLRRPCAEGASTLKVRVLFPHGHNPGFGIPVYAGGAHPPDREGAAVKVTARLTKKGRRLARAHGARKLAAKLGSAGIADYWRNPIRGEAPERTWVPIGTCFHDYQRPRSFPCAQTCPPFPGMPTGYLMYTALDMVYGSTTCRRGAALPPVPMG